MVKNIILIVFGCALLCGCSTVQIKTQFNETEFAAFNTNGTATLIGQAFLKTRGGDVKFAAGSEVQLIPSTFYSAEWATGKFVKHQRVTPMDVHVDKYIRKTIADASGNFEFDDLPAGQYYVVTTIVWEINNDPFGVNQQGGQVCKTVNIKDGEKIKFILTL